MESGGSVERKVNFALRAAAFDASFGFPEVHLRSKLQMAKIANERTFGSKACLLAVRLALIVHGAGEEKPLRRLVHQYNLLIFAWQYRANDTPSYVMCKSARAVRLIFVG